MMDFRTTRRFDREYARLSREIQDRIDKQLALLLSNPAHPSLRLEKAEGYANIWKARVTQGYRMTFHREGRTYILRRVGTHDILRNP